MFPSGRGHVPCSDAGTVTAPVERLPAGDRVPGLFPCCRLPRTDGFPRTVGARPPAGALPTASVPASQSYGGFRAHDMPGMIGGRGAAAREAIATPRSAPPHVHATSLPSPVRHGRHPATRRSPVVRRPPRRHPNGSAGWPSSPQWPPAGSGSWSVRCSRSASTRPLYRWLPRSTGPPNGPSPRCSGPSRSRTCPPAR